jgi:hypothetical protein
VDRRRRGHERGEREALNTTGLTPIEAGGLWRRWMGVEPADRRRRGHERGEREALNTTGLTPIEAGGCGGDGWESNPPPPLKNLENSRGDTPRNGPIRHGLDLEVQTDCARQDEQLSLCVPKACSTSGPSSTIALSATRRAAVRSLRAVDDHRRERARRQQPLTQTTPAHRAAGSTPKTARW